MRVTLALTALAVAISAQSIESGGSVPSVTSSASLSSATSSVRATSTQSGPYTHTIAVAKGGHSFSPEVTQAEVGDTIEFEFYPKNHSVVRAEYGYPCVPYEMILGAGHYGFWTGWKPVDTVLDNPPKWSMTVNDTDPIFFYCGAPGSCIGYGMVGAINPNASTSLAQQKQLAEASTFVLVPGEDWPSEGSIPSGVATTTASATPTGTISAATVTATAAPSHGLGTGAIAGIAIGGAAVLLAAGVAIWFCGRQSRRGQQAPLGSAQEVQPGFNPPMGSMYGKPGHMSTVSGYSMPPGYDHAGMRSPNTRTPVDPMMGQQQPMMMHPSSTSPHTGHASPVYAPNNMYTTGTHHVAPAEMEGGSNTPQMGRSSPRRSMEKPGVERYS